MMHLTKEITFFDMVGIVHFAANSGSSGNYEYKGFSVTNNNKVYNLNARVGLNQCK